MKNTDHNKTSADNLRRKAEDEIKKESTSPDQSLSEGGTLKLLHELQVHQIELVMQNEELMEVQKNEKKAEKELSKSQEEFRDLFDNAPVGYHELDSEGRIVKMNQTELNMLGFT